MVQWLALLIHGSLMDGLNECVSPVINSVSVLLYGTQTSECADKTLCNTYVRHVTLGERGMQGKGS